RRGGSGLHRRMLRQVEIVVAREGEQAAAATLDPDSVLAQGLGQRPAQVLPVERIQFCLREGVERVHQVSCGRPAGKEAPNGGEYQRKSRPAGLVCGGPRSRLAALYADEDGTGATGGRVNGGRAPSARGRARVDRWHRLLVDCLPRL